MKRLFDFGLALFALLILLIPLGLVAVLVKLTSAGPIVYWSDRVGRLNKIFKMPKFRTMRVDTQAVATHLLSDPKQFLTPVGSLLRKSSLDELPQLWSIFKGVHIRLSSNQFFKISGGNNPCYFKKSLNYKTAMNLKASCYASY